MDAGTHDYFRRLNDAMAAGGMAWWEMELPAGVVFFHENKALMLGYDPKKFVHYSDFTDLLHPDDYPVAMQAMRDLLEGRTDTYVTAYRIKTKDGTYKTLYDRGKIVQQKDGEMRVAGMVFDASLLKDGLQPEAAALIRRL